MRRAVGLELALVADRETAVVAVPLRGTLARVRGHTSTAILAFLFTDGCSAIFSTPLRRAGTGIGPRAIATVAARRRANGRRAIGVEPAVLALARVRRDAFSSIRAFLDA